MQLNSIVALAFTNVFSAFRERERITDECKTQQPTAADGCQNPKMQLYDNNNKQQQQQQHQQQQQPFTHTHDINNQSFWMPFIPRQKCQLHQDINKINPSTKSNATKTGQKTGRYARPMLHVCVT